MLIAAVAATAAVATVYAVIRMPVDRGDRIEDLDLAEGEGIVEQMFFRVFDGRYVGVVRNQLGPRVGRLADYLEQTAPNDHDPVEFISLAHADTDAAAASTSRSCGRSL